MTNSNDYSYVNDQLGYSTDYLPCQAIQELVAQTEQAFRDLADDDGIQGVYDWFNAQLLNMDELSDGEEAWAELAVGF